MALEIPTISLDQFRPGKSSSCVTQNQETANSELRKYLSCYHHLEKKMTVKIEWPPIFTATSKSTWLSTRKVAADIRQQEKEQQKEINNPWLLRGAAPSPVDLSEKLRAGLCAAGQVNIATNKVEERIPLPLSDEIPAGNKSVKGDLASQVRMGLQQAGNISLIENTSKNYDDEVCYQNQCFIQSKSEDQMSASCTSISSTSSSIHSTLSEKSRAEKVREGLLLAGANFAPVSAPVQRSKVFDMSQMFANIYPNGSLDTSSSLVEDEAEELVFSVTESFKMPFHSTSEPIEAKNATATVELPAEDITSKENVEEKFTTSSDLSQWVMTETGDVESEASIVTLDTLTDCMEDFDDFSDIENELQQWRV